MTRKELLENILAVDQPQLMNVEGSMVYMLWEDGEVTLTKSGSILWCRTLHAMEPPCLYDQELIAFLRENMPHKKGSHAFVVCENEHVYNQIKAMMVACDSVDPVQVVSNEGE